MLHSAVRCQSENVRSSHSAVLEMSTSVVIAKIGLAVVPSTRVGKCEVDDLGVDAGLRLDVYLLAGQICSL